MSLALKPRKNLYSYLVILLLSFSTVACTTVTNEVTGRKQLITIDESQDATIGLQAMNEVRKTNKFVTDRRMVSRVSRIGKKIAAVSDRPNMKWEFVVIDEPVLNAWALPGGKIAVYRKMVESLSDQELAAVLGHEVAHAVLRHGAEMMSRAQIQQMVVGAISVGTGMVTKDEETTAMATSIASMASKGFVQLPHSRNMELEADWIGTRYMARAGFDPRYAVSLWRKMAKMKDASGKPPVFLSTHPSDEKRIARIEARMDEFMQEWKR